MLSFTSLKGSPASEIRDFLDSKFARGATLKHVMVEFYWAIPELRMKKLLFSVKVSASESGSINDTCTGGTIELHINSICLIS